MCTPHRTCGSLPRPPRDPCASANGSAKPASTTDWGELGFPQGTTFRGVKLIAYDWTYAAPSICEHWNDAINPGDDGQGPADGNITGVNACT